MAAQHVRWLQERAREEAVRNGLVRKAVESRDEKGQRLAAACGGARANVLSHETDWNGSRLKHARTHTPRNEGRWEKKNEPSKHVW